MNKEDLLQQIVASLSADLNLLTDAARTAHAAATHIECLPDNKYDTTALEASYIAQGQANRAQEIRRALESYRHLELRTFNDETPIRLTALVTIEGEDGLLRRLFLGPAAGGMKLVIGREECLVITPESVLGRTLLGRRRFDEFQSGNGLTERSFSIIEVV